jgi:hypothetical protein
VTEYMEPPRQVPAAEATSVGVKTISQRERVEASMRAALLPKNSPKAQPVPLSWTS